MDSGHDVAEPGGVEQQAEGVQRPPQPGVCALSLRVLVASVKNLRVIINN